MTVVENSAQEQPSQEAYLEELYVKAASGDGEALTELSSIAQGRNDIPLARDLVLKLEQNQ